MEEIKIYLLSEFEYESIKKQLQDSGYRSLPNPTYWGAKLPKGMYATIRDYCGRYGTGYKIICQYRADCPARVEYYVKGQYED